VASYVSVRSRSRRYPSTPPGVVLIRPWGPERRQGARSPFVGSRPAGNGGICERAPWRLWPSWRGGDNHGSNVALCAARGRTRGTRGTPPLSHRAADRSRMACDLTRPPSPLPPSPPPPSPVTLLQLPEDVFLLVAIPLGPVDLSSLACATRALKLPARVWRLFLERAFGDVPSVQRALHQASMPRATELGATGADHRNLFAFLAFGVRTPNAVPKLLGHCPLLAPPDEDGSLPLVELGCGGSLVLRPLSSREQRCPCVAARTPQLPLQLASLGRARSACLGSGGFNSMLSSLRRHFACGEARPNPHPEPRARLPRASALLRSHSGSHSSLSPRRTAAQQRRCSSWAASWVSRSMRAPSWRSTCCCSAWISSLASSRPCRCGVCLPPCAPAYLRTCVPAYLPTYLPTYLPGVGAAGRGAHRECAAPCRAGGASRKAGAALARPRPVAA